MTKRNNEIIGVLMAVGAIKPKVETHEPAFDDKRARSNISAGRKMKSFMKRSKTKYRTCPSCGAVEDPNVVQLFYCRSCNAAFPDKKAVGGYEERDPLDVIQDTFRKHGFGIRMVQITAIGDSFEVAIDNVGEGQLFNSIDYHNEWFTRPAMEASVEIGKTTDYILADTRPVLKEGYPGGVQKFIYWFKRKGT